MTINAVQVFSIPVTDQDRARDFYVDVLGFELISDTQLSPEMRWVLVAPPGARTAVTLVTWIPSMEPGSLKGTVFESDDLEGDVARLKELGVTIEGGIEQAPWGAFVQIEDPDGNGIVLQETAETFSR